MRVIEREMGYLQGQPAMILKPAGRDNRNRFVIKLGDLWKYSDTHNDNFSGFITGKVQQICKLFDLDVPTREQQFTQMMVSISDTIMDGIDEMVKTHPYILGKDDPDSVIDKPADVAPRIHVGLMH